MDSTEIEQFVVDRSFSLCYIQLEEIERLLIQYQEITKDSFKKNETLRIMILLAQQLEDFKHDIHLLINSERQYTNP